MIAALLAFSLQAASATAPVPTDTAEEEIVVTAKVGRVALVFDKGTDGRLRNCRVFKSSGVDSIDREACSDLPDCIESAAGKQYCGKQIAAAVPPIKAPPPEPPKAEVDIGELMKPAPAKIPAVGPVTQVLSDEPSDQLVKLPPLPKDETHEPAIKITGNASN